MQIFIVTMKTCTEHQWLSRPWSRCPRRDGLASAPGMVMLIMIFMMIMMVMMNLVLLIIHQHLIVQDLDALWTS